MPEAWLHGKKWMWEAVGLQPHYQSFAAKAREAQTEQRRWQKEGPGSVEKLQPHAHKSCLPVWVSALVVVTSYFPTAPRWWACFLEWASLPAWVVSAFQTHSPRLLTVGAVVETESRHCSKCWVSVAGFQTTPVRLVWLSPSVALTEQIHFAA
jgi:hypothetical protein